MELPSLDQVMNEAATPISDECAYVGQNPKILDTMDLIKQIGPMGSEVSVLISGETGTGKDLVARGIHYNGPRKDKVFRRVNCAAIPESMFESELFGHKQGAFTNASRNHNGHVKMADKGVLLLDEIAEMPMHLQAKLLGFLQDGSYQPLGSQEESKSDVQVIAATNKNIEQAIKEKEFRLDLYYRLNVVEIRLPSLRDRIEDIPYIVRYIANKVKKDLPAESKTMPNVRELGDITDQFMLYDWPGNIRELENVVKQYCFVGKDQIASKVFEQYREKVDIVANYLGENQGSVHDGIAKLITHGLRTGKIHYNGDDLDTYKHVVEAAFLIHGLEKYEGKRENAAGDLGMAKRTFQRKMKECNLN